MKKDNSHKYLHGTQKINKQHDGIRFYVQSMFNKYTQKKTINYMMESD